MGAHTGNWNLRKCDVDDDCVCWEVFVGECNHVALLKPNRGTWAVRYSGDKNSISLL